MKTRAAVLLTAALAVAMGWAGSARAAMVYWDSASSAGDWNTTNLNWATGTGGPYTTAYGATAHDAVFEGTAGAVTIAATTPSAESLTFTTGGYTIGGGTLTLSVGDAGLIATGANDATINSVIAGTVGLTKTGSGILTLGGVSTYTGTTAVQNGVLQLSGGNNRLKTGTTAAAGSTVILGSGTDSGTFKLDGNSQQLYSIGTSGTGTANQIVNGSGTLATLEIQQTGSTGGFTFAGRLGGDGTNDNNFGLTIQSATTTPGTYTLSGNNTFTGPVNVNRRASLVMGSSTALNASNNVSLTHNTFSGGTNGNPTLMLNGFSVDIGTLSAQLSTAFVSNTSATDATLTINQSSNTTYPGKLVDGTGAGKLSIVKQGSATLTLTGVGPLYTGSTSVLAGKLLYGATGVIYTGDVSVNGATAILDLATFSDTVGTVTLAGDGTIASTTGVLTTTGTFEMQDGLVSAKLAGMGIPLNKTTGGTVTLTGENTYTGATTVSAGTLLVNNTTGSGLGTGSVSVTGGVLGGTGSFTGSVTVGGSGTLAPGASIQSLATGAATFNSGSTFLYDLDSIALNGDLLVAAGALTINATSTLTFNELPTGTLSVGSKLTLVNYSGTWNSGTFNGYANNSTFVLGTNTWQIKYDDTSGGTNFSSEQGAAGFDNYLTITVVPEPSTFAMLLFGSLLWWAVDKKRRT